MMKKIETKSIIEMEVKVTAYHDAAEPDVNWPERFVDVTLSIDCQKLAHDVILKKFREHIEECLRDEIESERYAAAEYGYLRAM